VLPSEMIEDVAKCAVFSLVSIEHWNDADVPKVDWLRYSREDPRVAEQVDAGSRVLESYNLLSRNVARQNAAIVGKVRNALQATTSQHDPSSHPSVL